VTREEVLDVLSVVALKWPHSNLGAPEEAVAGWLDELAAFDRGDVEAAVRRLSGAGREFAPTAGIVAQEVRLAQQGEPPSFDDFMAGLGRWLPSRVFLYDGEGRERIYDPDANYTAVATAQAIAVMQEAGAHEAVLRFVGERGLRAVLRAPDGSRYPLDRNQLADRRDMARSYRDETVTAWRRNPQPGLALERALGRAGLVDDDVLALVVATRRELERLARPALPSAPGEPVADESVVEFDLADLIETYRSDRARARLEQQAQRRAAAAAEDERVAAAERELADHAAKRRPGGDS
jgi:hypothetical protein